MKTSSSSGIHAAPVPVYNFGAPAALVMQPTLAEILANGELTTAQASELIECETVIGKGLNTFIEVGQRLVNIRDKRLYRYKYGTFEEYCERRWGMTGRRARQLSDASRVIENLGTYVPKPQTEGQARPLTALPAADQRPAWEEAREVAKPDEPTAKQVKAVVDRKLGKSRNKEITTDGHGLTRIRNDEQEAAEKAEKSRLPVQQTFAGHALNAAAIGEKPAKELPKDRGRDLWAEAYTVLTELAAACRHESQEWGLVNRAMDLLKEFGHLRKTNRNGAAKEQRDQRGEAGRAAADPASLSRAGRVEKACFVIERRSASDMQKKFFLTKRGGWSPRRQYAEYFDSQLAAHLRLGRRVGYIRRIKA
jgi:hypothetical protein